MQIIELIFKIGVLLAIYGFIWFFINLLISLLSGGRKKSIGEVYFSKGVKSVFLVNVLFLYGMDSSQNGIDWFNMIISGLILLLYFIGQMQKDQQQAAMMDRFSGMLSVVSKTRFNRKAEIIVVTIAFLVYTFFFFFPEFAKNPIAQWFYQQVTGLEKTPIIGFIFKLIGFFFLLGILLKITNGIMFLISGKPIMNVSGSFKTGNSRKENDDDFDDFEELKNELPEDQSKGME
jgi:hypothetical protein